MQIENAVQAVRTCSQHKGYGSNPMTKLGDIQFKIATSPVELQMVARLRHKIFVTQDRAMPAKPNGLLDDRFDRSPLTTNLMALCKGELVGCVRLTAASAEGTATDLIYDFLPYLPEKRHLAISAGMLCMKKRFRGKSGLTSELIKTALSYSHQHA